MQVLPLKKKKKERNGDMLCTFPYTSVRGFGELSVSFHKELPGSFLQLPTFTHHPGILRSDEFPAHRHSGYFPSFTIYTIQRISYLWYLTHVQIHLQVKFLELVLRGLKIYKLVNLKNAPVSIEVHPESL